MTTTQQESTFTGGLENQQTTLQIKLGVLKDMVTVSLSKSPIPSVRLTILSQSKTTIHNTSNLNNQIQVDSPQVRLKIIKRFKSKYSGVKIEETELSQFLSVSPPTLHDCWVWTLIMHYATVRFFEIWGKGKISHVYRGIAGKTKNIQSSISGMIGGTLFNKDRAVDKDGKGNFYPRVWNTIYPDVIRWPNNGIEAARNLAYSMGNEDVEKND